MGTKCFQQRAAFQGFGNMDTLVLLPSSNGSRKKTKMAR